MLSALSLPAQADCSCEFVDIHVDPSRAFSLALEAVTATYGPLASATGALATANRCNSNAYEMQGIANDANAVAGLDNSVAVAVGAAA